MSDGYKGPEDPHWYKDAIIYELHVRAFFDSDGDGIGDFRGLTEKLDYLEDLGVNTLWLLPFYPSPLKDDGYDIADYTAVHPSYGTLADVQVFLKEAHRRGLRVITELVINHTSDQHPWFQRARRAKAGDPARDWYVWSDTPERYPDARVIFPDFEPSNWSWDPVAKAYYWHRFYAHQPDLNYENPAVHEAILQAADFWLKQGVDGFRLDAIPYLYEREGTSCENLPETHAFLKKLRKHIDDRYPNRLLLAEANQWPEDAAAYFGDGDECDMAFHFPIMTRLFLAVHMEDRYPMVDILTQTPRLPENAQWALFLRNHDELTLEMVTDQERDYMYRVYAQDRAARINLGIRRRLAPLLRNNRKKMELLNGLLFSLPGTPVVYYGDEIGMGDNIFLGDRNGVRTPMQWSGDRNAGFSRAGAQQMYLPVIVDPEYHYEALNVEAQQANPHSFFWWNKRVLALSRRFKAFGRGSFELLHPENLKVLAFLRAHQDEVVLVVANLSRFAQHVELDLRAMKGRVPVELFGRTPFPKIADAPYALTLGPHAFLWFSLELPREAPAPEDEAGKPLVVKEAWTELLSGKPRQALETRLLAWTRTRTWFAGRARALRTFRITEAFPLPMEDVEAAFVLVRAEYVEGEGETYSIPLAFLDGEAARAFREASPRDVVAPVRTGLLCDAMALDAFTRAWRRLGPIRAPSGRIAALPRGPERDGFQLHWYRHVQDGLHPEIEVAQALGEGAPVPGWGGHWDYARKGHEPITLAILRQALPESQDAWTRTLEALGRFFETARALPAPLSAPPPRLATLLAWEPPEDVVSAAGPYLESVRKMGECAARLHGALARDLDAAAFAPVPFVAAQVQNAYQAFRRKATGVFAALRKTAGAERVLAREAALLPAAQALLKTSVGSVRIRCHGDLTLRTLRVAGGGFLVVDLPGPSSGAFIERRIKRSPLWDVACLLLSLRAAAARALAEQEASGEVAPERWKGLEQAGAAWTACAARTFVKAYLDALKEPRLDPAKIEAPLRLALLERALDEAPTGGQIALDALAERLDDLEPA